MTRATSFLALLAVLALAPGARAQTRGNYLNVHGELMSFASTTQVRGPAGLAVDWGVLQNRYVATGTRLGFSMASELGGPSLFIGGGPQFHIHVDDHLLILPSFNLGYRISQQTGMGFAGPLALAVAYTHEKFYFGLEGETLAFGQNSLGRFQFFGWPVAVQGLFGLYYE